MNSLKNRWSLFIVLLITTAWLTIAVFGGKWQKHTVIKSDAAGYYAYLPAYLIYHDLFGCRFYQYIDSIYRPGDGVRYYGVHYHPESQQFYFKYTYGVAFFEAPFFYLAHELTKWSGKFPADGYSDWYQLAIACCAVVYGSISLFLLREFLLGHFSDTTTGFTLLLIGAGTNLFAQVITQPGLSHVYLFMLFSGLLYVAKRYLVQPQWIWAILLGAAIGLILVTRPVDVTVILFVLLWMGRLLKQKASWQQHFVKIGMAVLVAFLIVFAQAIYWHLASGHWILYTYNNEYFQFAKWHIIDGLFSFRKGWFLYTPMAAMGFLVFFFWGNDHRIKEYQLPFFAYFAITLYLTFCWKPWYYGGSFGCRPLVESLAILALPLAVLVEHTAKLPLFRKGIMITVLMLMLILNVFQTAQYARGIIHWQRMNEAYYWRVFGKWQVNEEDKKLLNKTPND